MPTDADLLQRYASEHAQDAFAEFVNRNVGLVYSAALPRTGGRAHLAEDVAQKVFSDASRKAAALARHPALAGWLHQSTRFAATDALRGELRRQNLASSLASMHDDSNRQDPSPDWDKLRPILDEVMDELGERDRELMLLRYFHGCRCSDRSLHRETTYLQLSNHPPGERAGASKGMIPPRSNWGQVLRLR